VPVPDYTDQMKMNKNLGAWLLRIAGIVLALFGVDYMLAAFHWPTLLSWLPPYDAGDLSIGLLSLVLACRLVRCSLDNLQARAYLRLRGNL